MDAKGPFRGIFQSQKILKNENQYFCLDFTNITTVTTIVTTTYKQLYVSCNIKSLKVEKSDFFF